jgi:hypothetical protein
MVNRYENTITFGVIEMKLSQNAVLVCQNEDCRAEVVVAKPCPCPETKGDIEATCCGKPMVLKPTRGGCGCCTG